MNPNDLLLHEMKSRHMSQRRLAEHLAISPAYLSDLLRGTRGISMQIALKLELVFDYSAEYWMDLQTKFTLAQMRTKQLDRGSEK